MKKPTRRLFHILSFVLVLAAFLFINRQEAVANAAGTDRIYYFNMDDKGLEGSMILVQTDGHWGLMDAGHTKATTVSDASGRTYSTTVHGLSSQVYCRNGADVANYMISNLGVTHLDFVVGTHAHSDHVGGIPGVAAATYRDASGSLRYLVDSNTTYYYKEYQHISDVEDDLVRYSSDSWHNQAFAYQAKTAMANQGATLIDVSKSPQIIHGDPGNAYGDYVTFEIGNMSFRLYNVYEQTNTGSENVNSIVTVMTNGEYSVVNLSDINTNNGAIDKTSAAIAKDFGAVDVVVAGHHGYTGSNTKAMFDALQPSYVIVPNGMESSWLYTDGDLAAAIPYAQGRFDTAFYNLSISPYAVVTDLSGRQVYIYSVTGNGNLSNAINKMMRAAKRTGWVSWMNTGGTLWMYLENGNPVKGRWRYLDGDWYHFDSTGIMQTGWVTTGGSKYYFKSSGAMASGWQIIDGYWYYLNPDQNAKKFGAVQTGWKKYKGDWYYMDSSGKMLANQWHGKSWLTSSGAAATGWQKISGDWYLFDDDGDVRTGWQKDDGEWYYMFSNGRMARNTWVGNYYLKGNGVMATGWQTVNGSWYYLDSNGKKQTGWKKYKGDWYYMDSSGKMLANQWHGKSWLTSSGAAATGWQRIGGDWYLFDGDGDAKTGWQKDDDEWYYLYSDGKMAKNTWVGNYYLKGNGVMATGWQTVNGSWYYLDSNGKKQTGWKKYKGDWYYMDGNGKMLANQWHGKSWLTSSGTAATGWQKIDDDWYLFDGEGDKLTGWQKHNGKDYYFYSDGRMAADAWVDGYYVDSTGAWVKGASRAEWEAQKAAEAAAAKAAAEAVAAEAAAKEAPKVMAAATVENNAVETPEAQTVSTETSVNTQAGGSTDTGSNTGSGDSTVPTDGNNECVDNTTPVGGNTEIVGDTTPIGGNNEAGGSTKVGGEVVDNTTPGGGNTEIDDNTMPAGGNTEDGGSAGTGGSAVGAPVTTNTVMPTGGAETVDNTAAPGGNSETVEPTTEKQETEEEEEAEIEAEEEKAAA